MTFDLTSILESKRQLRGRLASLPIGDKLRLLDYLRGREADIRKAAEKRHSTCKKADASGNNNLSRNL